MSKSHRSQYLLLHSKSLKHLFFWVHIWIILTESFVDDSPGTLSFLSLLYQSKFSLDIRSNAKKESTVCSLASLLIPGLPTLPLTFLPNTSCFSRVNFVSKALNCSSMRFNFSVRSGSLSPNCFRFRFLPEGLVTARNDSLKAFSWEPFFPMAKCEENVDSGENPPPR